MNKWVDCNYMLPERSCFVIGWSSELGIPEQVEFHDGKFRIFRECGNNVIGVNSIVNITHWMHMPIGPNGESCDQIKSYKFNCH